MAGRSRCLDASALPLLACDAARTAKLYQSLQLDQLNCTSLIAEPDHALPCGFPFEGPTTIQGIAVRLPGATPDSPPRWLILQLERCSAPFPFKRVIVDRDNNGAPGENAEDENLMPAWAKADKSESDVGTTAPDRFESNQEPRRDINIAKRMAGHSNVKTTELYDRRGDEVSFSEIERVGI
jgi:hypothetical protein